MFLDVATCMVLHASACMPGIFLLLLAKTFWGNRNLLDLARERALALLELSLDLLRVHSGFPHLFTTHEVVCFLGNGRIRVSSAPSRPHWQVSNSQHWKGNLFCYGGHQDVWWICMKTVTKTTQCVHKAHMKVRAGPGCCMVFHLG